MKINYLCKLLMGYNSWIINTQSENNRHNIVRMKRETIKKDDCFKVSNYVKTEMFLFCFFEHLFK